MKKLISSICTLAALVSLFSCSNSVIAPEQPIEKGNVPFVLDATVDTKASVSSDWAVEWKEGDIIYAVTSDELWGKAFVSKTETNIETIAEYVYNGSNFSTTSTIADGEHTFYFMHAASSQKTYHRGAGSTYRFAAAQDQNCSYPMAHLDSLDALAGKAVVTTPAGRVSATMSHLASFIKVTLKNNSGKDLTVNSFVLDLDGAKISGIFNVDFSGAKPVLSVNSAKTYYSDVTVNLTNGTLANGAEMPVYIAIPPVSNYTGKVTFTANTSEGTFTKTNTISSAVSFEAGTHNSAIFTLKPATPVDPADIHSYTFDLSTDNTSYCGTDKLTWSSTCATMESSKGSSSVNANNYTPKSSSYSSTRFYSNQILTITPNSGFTIQKVVFTVEKDSFASPLCSSTWTNATAAVSETNAKIVTVTPTNGQNEIKAKITSNTGATKVEIFFVNSSPLTKLTMSDISCTAQSSAALTFSWSAVENAIGYKVSLDGGVTYEETQSATSYIWRGLPASTTKTLYVKAIGDGFTYATSEAKTAQGTTSASSGQKQTYQHVFSTKPSTGNSVTLSGMTWAITATSLGSYNSANYAGVQLGTSSANGKITLTSTENWSYEGASKITEVRLWLNLGGTSVTPTVTIGGEPATSDGTSVVKNSGAKTDWTKATKVTFTPGDADTGVVVINVSTVKAGYICAMEIDAE